jgi:aminopeptidase N
MDAPIVNFYSFLSARYEVFRDKYNDINIEIFYHPTHKWNVDKMNASIKKTIAYCEKNFSPYQFKQVRIIEFPRYQEFAQSFPNTIPFSEAIGFIMDVDDENDVDMAYYVTSHEVAHQWWGHQVAGANTMGSTIMVESMAQYTALMVMEKEFSQKNIDKYLRYELDRYLAGRSFERKGEQPMVTCDNQQYIHYQKGSLVMYALKDLIGEDSLNAALSRFIKDFGFQSAPYVQSPTFVNYLRNATPDSLKYVITDLFEKMTLFNLQTTDASATQIGKNYKVKLKIDAEKVYSDSIGNEKKVPIKDWIDIGIFTEDAKGKDSLIYIKRNHFSKKENEFEITVSSKPTKAGIDPMYKLIDRATEDNLKDVTLEN